MSIIFVLLLCFCVVAAIANQSANNPSILAVVLACHRSSHLKKTLRSLAKHTPPSLASSIPVYVSIDEHPKSYRAARAANAEPNVKQVWQHIPPAEYSVKTTRDRIARHYYFALSRAFDPPEHANVSHVIVLEDDLLFAPDFVSYILAATEHLSTIQDHAVVCASAWNDNGRHGRDPRAAQLTTFFPGLGWVLPRALWADFLRPNWPGSPSTQSHGIVGIGWDFWLRVSFENHGWACVTPVVPRVFHFGATGSNVGADETETLYATSPLANLSAAEVDWRKELAGVVDADATRKGVQSRLESGHVVKSLGQALKYNKGFPVMPYLRENFRDVVANPLKLWPTPRGHFHHTFLVHVAPRKELLLYDERRASKYFSLPKNRDERQQLRFHQARRNSSCDEECQARGFYCTASSLELANTCESLAKVMSDGCRLGCAYETGNDLPARVADEAPLQTAGMCLIVESGAGDEGKLDCEGRHEWTTRSCACVAEAESEMRDEL